MNVTITFPDQFQNLEWDYTAFGVDNFLTHAMSSLWCSPLTDLYHRHCPACGADIHADIAISKIAEPAAGCAEWEYRMVPVDTCPRCRTATIPYRDRGMAFLEECDDNERQRICSMIGQDVKQLIHPVGDRAAHIAAAERIGMGEWLAESLDAQAKGAPLDLLRPE